MSKANRVDAPSPIVCGCALFPVMFIGRLNTLTWEFWLLAAMGWYCIGAWIYSRVKG